MTTLRTLTRPASLRLAGGLAVGAALLATTASCGSSAAADPAAAAGPTSTVTVTASPVAATSTPSADQAALAKRLAANACQSWNLNTTVSSAAGAEDRYLAASQSTTAAVLNPTWTPLAGSLGFLAGLPETGNSQADVDEASAQRDVLRSACANAGVTVS